MSDDAPGDSLRDALGVSRSSSPTHRRPLRHRRQRPRRAAARQLWHTKSCGRWSVRKRRAACGSKSTGPTTRRPASASIPPTSTLPAAAEPAPLAVRTARPRTSPPRSSPRSTATRSARRRFLELDPATKRFPSRLTDPRARWPPRPQPTQPGAVLSRGAHHAPRPSLRAGLGVDGVVQLVDDDVNEWSRQQLAGSERPPLPLPRRVTRRALDAPEHRADEQVHRQ